MWTLYSNIIIACVICLLSYLHKKLSEVPVRNFVPAVKKEEKDQIKLGE